MLVIDGPPQAAGTQARYPAGPLLFPRLAPGAAVYLDDAARSDEQAILRRWRSEFPLAAPVAAGLRKRLRAAGQGNCARRGAARATAAANHPGADALSEALPERSDYSALNSAAALAAHSACAWLPNGLS